MRRDSCVAIHDKSERDLVHTARYLQSVVSGRHRDCPDNSYAANEPSKETQQEEPEATSVLIEQQQRPHQRTKSEKTTEEGKKTIFPTMTHGDISDDFVDHSHLVRNWRHRIVLISEFRT